jgi:peptidoglycan/xylan/chitin deacetylase (PgdA/CDA1 family)
MAGRWLPREPVILMYHRIATPEYDPWDIAVSEASFEEQLDILKNERDLMLLEDLAGLFARGKLPANAAAITFDDGYACNALVAAPLLSKYGIPATFFLTTGLIGTNAEFWWDELADIIIESETRAQAHVLISGRRFELPFAAPKISGPKLMSWKATRRSREPRTAAYLAIWWALRPLSEAERRAALDAMWSASGRSPEPRASYRIMTPQEVCHLSTGLFRVAPHTMSHPALGGLTPTEQRCEISESRDACRALGGQISQVFAYPYGNFTPVTSGIVHELGFAAACSTHSRPVRSGDSHFELPRLQATNLAHRMPRHIAAAARLDRLARRLGRAGSLLDPRVWASRSG